LPLTKCRGKNTVDKQHDPGANDTKKNVKIPLQNKYERMEVLFIDHSDCRKRINIVNIKCPMECNFGIPHESENAGPV